MIFRAVMGKNNIVWRLIYATNRKRLHLLAFDARAAVKRRDFRENARLCREHDDLALGRG